MTVYSELNLFAFGQGLGQSHIQCARGKCQSFLSNLRQSALQGVKRLYGERHRHPHLSHHQNPDKQYQPLAPNVGLSLIQ